ncbi:insulinase family protein [Candidatus Parcubacteria bacterium]|nr:insulinase family protein [Candidatus Parcubacteria bacterium]
MKKFEYKKFPNGLRTILVPQQNSESLTVLVLVGTGSKYEEKEKNGISHFLEHMYFKGTKKRPSPKEVAEVLDKVGGIFNAFTSQEYTGYFAKVSSDKLTLALEWVSDILFNSIFPEEEVIKERGVIVEEINMIEDNPMSAVQLLWQEVLYGDQPAGWPIAGKKETVEKIERKDLFEYMHSQYIASNVIVALAGNFSPKEAVSKIKKFFQPIKRGKRKERPPLIENQKIPQVLLKKRNTNQVHLVLGARGVNLFSKEKYQQEILATILGGMMSSRLFQEIREKMGIAYYIHTESHSDLDSGFLATSAGLKIEKTEVGIKRILKEYKEIAKTLTQKELKKAKDNLKGKLSLLLETLDSRAIFYALQELLEGKILTPEEIFSKINRISLSQIRNFANKIFCNKNLNLAILGPFEKKEIFEKILKI